MIPKNLRIKCCGSTPEYSKLMQKSLLYGKALEVARIGNEDFETYDIVMKYFLWVRKKLRSYCLLGAMKLVVSCHQEMQQIILIVKVHDGD